MKLALTSATLAPLLVLVNSAAGQPNNAQVKPLFSVKPDHELANAEATFAEVRDLILEDYYTEDIHQKALYWAAIEGMLRFISPPESPDLAKIWTPDEYSRILDTLKGEQVSVGIKSSFDANAGALTITEVLPGSPAESILQPLDRILRIDSKPLKGKTVSEVNELLYGDEGIDVSLTVNRDVRVFEITLTRRRFRYPNLIVEEVSPEILHIEIRKFYQGIKDDLNAELASLDPETTKGLIIDLRGNTGGVFGESLKCAELFLPAKSIILRTFDRKKKLQNYISSNENPYSFALVVLTNADTASSAEILSSALQDHRKALIVGVKTRGKGVFETTYTLENDFRVKFITGAMYTPKGKAWQNKGLTPDFLVDQESRTLQAMRKLALTERLKRDVPLITAFKLLKRSWP